MNGKKKGLPLWADLIIWFLLSFFAFLISEEATIALLPGMDREAQIYSYTSTALTTLLLSLTVLIQHCLLDRQPWQSLGLGFNRTFTRYAPLACAVPMAILTLGFLICLLTGSITVSSLQWTGWDFGISIAFWVMAAFAEEILIRGYFQARLCRTRLHPWGAIVLSSVLFAALHLGNSHIAVIPMIHLFVSGILLGALYYYTGNLWLPTLLHSVWNWYQGSILGFSVSGNNHLTTSVITQQAQVPDWLNGGAFGFEGSLTGILLQVVFTAWFIYYLSRHTTRKTLAL